MELLLIALSPAWAEDCPDPAAEIAVAEQLVLYADVAGGTAALQQAEAAFGCSAPASPLVLARMWLVEGALLTDTGEPDSAAAAFAAARRLAPGLWIDALGVVKRRDYENAATPVGTGQVVLDLPDVDSGTAWVDGTEASVPIRLPAGEHLVQYGSDNKAWFEKMVLVSADQVLHVTVPAPPERMSPPPAPDPAPVANRTQPTATPAPPPPVEKRPGTHGYAHSALGADLAFGGSLGDVTHARPTDPQTTIMLPIEIGGGVEGRLGWIRAVAVVAPVLSGELVYTAVGGERQDSPVAAGVYLAGGLSIGPCDFGVLAGARWPTQGTTRLLVAFNVPGVPIQVEARVGANVALDGLLQPAASMVLAFPGTSD